MQQYHIVRHVIKQYNANVMERVTKIVTPNTYGEILPEEFNGCKEMDVVLVNEPNQILAHYIFQKENVKSKIEYCAKDCRVKFNIEPSSKYEMIGVPDKMTKNINKSTMIMKHLKCFFLFVISLSFISCMDNVEKADKLRIENKFEEAAELYKEAAAEGNAYAMWRLANAYSNGDGVDYDEKKAWELLNQASDGGCDEAKCDLAYSYLFGWYSIGEDKTKGKAMLDKLVKETDNTYVLSKYAALILRGEEPYVENKDKAVKILESVRDKNAPEYLFQMAMVYMFGTDNIDINAKKATEYLTKSFNCGRRYSAYVLCSIYFYGLGDVNKDLKKCIDWCEKGIMSNETECMMLMSSFCLSEDSIDQQVHNPQRGIELLKKAIRHGSGRACATLGNYYQEGKYIEKDDDEAFKLYKKAFERKSADGAFSLGFAYIEGIGCDKNVKKGIEVWKKAVEYGSGSAANNLYCYYNYGNYADKSVIDKEEAKKWIKKGATLGDSYACWNIAKEYYWGKLFEKSDHQAFTYMKKAADMGHPEACSWVAYFYDNGIGCNQDPYKAKEYKEKAKPKEDKEK